MIVLSLIWKQEGNSALSWSAKHGHEEIVQRLLARGAYFNLPDKVSDPLLNHFRQSSTGCRETALILLHFAPCLMQKTRAILSTNQYRSKTKRDLNARVFPRLRLCSRVYFEFWLVRYVVHLFFWLAVGIAMVLDTKSNHVLLETILTQDI